MRRPPPVPRDKSIHLYHGFNITIPVWALKKNTRNDFEEHQNNICNLVFFKYWTKYIPGWLCTWFWWPLPLYFCQSCLILYFHQSAQGKKTRKQSSNLHVCVKMFSGPDEGMALLVCKIIIISARLQLCTTRVLNLEESTPETKDVCSKIQRDKNIPIKPEQVRWDI